MTVPYNTVNVQGIGSVTADGLNTYIQTVPSLAALRRFPGVGQMEIALQGFVNVGDGGQGNFVWSATAIGPDDGANVIMPVGALVGAWIRLPSGGAFTSVIRAITYVIDGVGSVPSTGFKGQLSIPFACNIQSVTLLADQAGSAVVDIWKVPFASYNPPSAPTVGNSICGTDLPTLAGASSLQDAALTGWTTTINANDTLSYHLNSVATITRLTITLKAQ